MNHFSSLMAAACGGLLFCVACGEAPGGTDGGTNADAGSNAGPPQVVFDLNGEFFDAPYPSDLRVDDRGHPAIADFPRARGLVQDAVNVVAEERPGFSPLTGIYFRFTAPLSVSIPADPAARAEEASPIWLIDADPASPDRGTRLPAYATFYGEETRMWPGNCLAIRPVPGIHLHPGRRYAAIVRATLDSTLERSAAFEALKTDTTSREGLHYAELFSLAEELGVDRSEVVAATMFTVSDPTSEMDRARAYIMSQPLPEVRDWRVVRVLNDELRVEATFETYELLDDEPPYAELGTGRIHFDQSGAPAAVRRVPVKVGISVPTSEPPAGGHPVVVYGHGTGGDSTTHFGAEGTALNEIGVASLGFDAALHGIRDPGNVAVESLIASNPVAAREVVRQTVIDTMLIYRMIEAGAFTVPAELNSGTAAPLSSAHPMYMGHSQGAQEAGVLLGVEPQIEAAFLSEGGAAGIITIAERELTEGTPINCLIASLVNEDCPVMTEDHPLITLVVQPILDPADPASFAHRFVRERPAGWSPLSVAMTEGGLDGYTPPRSIEALAVAIGLPIVEPRALTSDPFILVGTPTAAPPVITNLSTTGGVMVTGGLIQFPNEGHFAIYRNDDAKNRYVQFFRTFVEAGAATIVAPQ